MEWNKITLFFLTFLLVSTTAFSQVGENRYVVFFTDKDNTPYSISQPLAYLSQKSIDRRQNQGIAIDEKDLPVDPAYIQAVRDLGEVEIINPLKWMNAILIETTDPDVLQGLSEISGFDKLEVSRVFSGEISLDFEKGLQPKSDSDYGPSLNQIQMLNGIQLHNDGYRGEGMWIAVLDGGYSHAEDAAALVSLFDDNRIIGKRNFVDNDDQVFQRSNHGTHVLSTMAGFQIDSLIGTAPRASYMLGITEDVSIERKIEEVYWEIGAEYADSIGVDIINTSLGYTSFDIVEEGYTYSDMDGKTALMTRAADIAASRGMLIVVSAGNQGNKPWYYISVPADGDSVLTIGAVNPIGNAAGFSSRGPTYDGRVKPNVMAQGSVAVVSDLGSGITRSNGTSFSSPIISGMSACLWQAYPTATAWDVFQAIEKSASLFETPNDSMGFGIPDFEIARALLGQVVNVDNRANDNSKTQFQVYPNPYSTGNIRATLPHNLEYPISVSIVDASAKSILNQTGIGSDSALEQKMTKALNTSQSGMYFIIIQDYKRQVFTSKILKD